MRIAIQAVISDIEGQEPCTEDIGVLEYNAEAASNSGLCFFIGASQCLQRTGCPFARRGGRPHHGSDRGAAWRHFCSGVVCVAPTSTRP
jgi:hypothetical protein